MSQIYIYIYILYRINEPDIYIYIYVGILYIHGMSSYRKAFIYTFQMLFFNIILNYNNTYQKNLLYAFSRFLKRTI